MTTRAKPAMESGLADRFRAVRALTRDLAAPLSDADATLQPMPDASPAKWHLAHVTWFFESFVLRDHVPGHRPLDPRWAFLFNSYYEGEGPRHARPRRGMLSRPSLAEVLAWREAVDSALLAALPALDSRARAIVELGLQHEQQHQELLLMDIQAAFAENPLLPAVWEAPSAEPRTESQHSAGASGANGALTAPAATWITGRQGLVEIGHDGDGFAFDCEGPRHRVHLAPHALASRPITNAEWEAFIDAGGYTEPLLWLSDGWDWVVAHEITAPLYWTRRDGDWARFGLSGEMPLLPHAPVCHVSFFEADAFARWAGARLPTEAEWESAAAGHDPRGGNQLDAAGPVAPQPAAELAAEHGPGLAPRHAPAPAPEHAPSALTQLFGDAWEWTTSAFSPYPGFRPVPGTLGEYNGKFMSGQLVLRGGSCATPRGHVRASYRNFFRPEQRWMFSGVRLARDV